MAHTRVGTVRARACAVHVHTYVVYLIPVVWCIVSLAHRADTISRIYLDRIRAAARGRGYGDATARAVRCAACAHAVYSKFSILTGAALHDPRRAAEWPSWILLGWRRVCWPLLMLRTRPGPTLLLGCYLLHPLRVVALAVRSLC
eukprot:SAG31_NODE_237_length_19590_cov_13.149915_2_plen_145_part_00